MAKKATFSASEGQKEGFYPPTSDKKTESKGFQI